jgi:hypothetical protein
MEDERQPLTYDEAVAMLPDADHIHTFRGTGPVLIGADWPRDELLLVIQKYGAELSGENATRMGHGIVVIDDHGALFVEAKQVK